jgi:prepilin-type N-terminal cleavage/methylation domain-containing protein
MQAKKIQNIRQRRQKGFTLLEIMTVLTIIGVLAALVVPNIKLGKSKGAELHTFLTTTGKALAQFRQDTSTYPTKLAALYDKSQAGDTFQGIDARDNWRQAYIVKQTFDSSGNIQISQIVTGATVTILRQTHPSGTGDAWILRANGIPNDILQEALRSAMAPTPSRHLHDCTRVDHRHD